MSYTVVVIFFSYKQRLHGREPPFCFSFRNYFSAGNTFQLTLHLLLLCNASKTRRLVKFRDTDYI